MLKHCPIMVGIFLMLLLFSLWRAPISIAFLVCSAGLGLVYGTLVFGFFKNHLNLALTLTFLFVPAGQVIVPYFFFSDPTWKVLFQHGSLVSAVMFSLGWMLRRRIVASFSDSDAENALGADLS